jgi:hypothetical protein
MSKTSLAVDQDDRRLIRIAASLRNMQVQEMTHAIIMAGLKEVAPEVLEEIEANATSDITPEQFKERYRGEEATLSRRVLRRARRT